MQSFVKLYSFYEITFPTIEFMFDRIQGGRKVLRHTIFTGRAGCRELCKVGNPCLEMNSNAAMGPFFA